MSQLPLSVLIPTRNSMAHLPAHLDAARSWLPLAAQIVVVDSESTDGTVPFLQEQLKQLSPLIVLHPPGLYESWNFGISQCTGRFIYISTVGDTIQADGLRQLVNVAEAMVCDVVISPPRLVDVHGREVKRSWPILELIDRWKLRQPVAMGGHETLLLALAFMRKAFLGSSASNLYRADCLKSRPFPTDFGHAGDVGWGLRHAPEIRLGIAPERISTFLFHPKPTGQRGRPGDDSGAQRIEAARATLQRVRNALPQNVATMSDRLCAVWGEVFASNRERDRLERKGSRSILSLGGWRNRAERKRALAALTAVQAEALQMIAARLVRS